MSHLGYDYLPDVRGMRDSNSHVISEIISDGEELVNFEFDGHDGSRSEFLT